MRSTALAPRCGPGTACGLPQAVSLSPAALAACLLLAGFLGVGSAIAQPHVLRVWEAAAIMVNLETDQVHCTTCSIPMGMDHYVIGTMSAAIY